MEPKKVKKLVLKHETISSLNEGSMNNLKGASGWDPVCMASMLEPFACIYSDYISCKGANCGGGSGGCTVDTNDGDCGTWNPDCNNTCGSAYTCNGK